MIQSDDFEARSVSKLKCMRRTDAARVRVLCFRAPDSGSNLARPNVKTDLRIPMEGNMENVRSDAIKTYAAIREAIFAWNWEGAETAFRSFCDAYRAHIPVWFEDEYVFNGAKLWAANRPAQLLRHFATFLDRAAPGHSHWDEVEGEQLRQAAALAA